MNSNEKILPAPDILNQLEYGRFVLANLAAKRAKQIKEGAPPLVRIDSNHPLSIALAEIAAGKIKPILGVDGHSPVELDDDFSTYDSMELNDVSLLLPAIDDEEASAISAVTLGGGFGDEDDDEHEEDEELGIGSLADILSEDEPIAAAAEEEGEMSLDDLAKVEEGDDTESVEEI